MKGQQFKVKEGDKLFVHHIQDAEAGKTYEFDKVLLVDNNGAISIGTPTVEGTKVVAEVLCPLVKSDKVIVFKKKRRKGYATKNGQRDQYSQIQVKEIVIGKAKAEAKAKAKED